MPDEPEVMGLLALMLLTESRRAARTGPGGALVLLADQDRTRWDRALIAEGQDLGPALPAPGTGPARTRSRPRSTPCTATRPTADATDWAQILALYDQLMVVAPTPVVALNRAVAVAEVDGPAVALASSTASISAGTTCSTPSEPTCCGAWAGPMMPCRRTRPRWPSRRTRRSTPT